MIMITMTGNGAQWAMDFAMQRKKLQAEKRMVLKALVANDVPD